MIELKRVSKRFGDVGVLRKVDLKIQDTETVAIFGHNGSGKTTLLKIIAGTLRPSSGEVSIHGLPPRSNRGILGYLGHEPHLYPTLTALENLRFFARLHDVPKADAEIALAVVGLERLGDSLVRHLSKGETQRVGLARALIHDPKVLLVDEPFSGLDADASDALPQLLKGEGRTVIIATHDAERARRFSDRTITLQDGSAT